MLGGEGATRPIKKKLLAASAGACVTCHFRLYDTKSNKFRLFGKLAPLTLHTTEVKKKEAYFESVSLSLDLCRVTLAAP